MSLARVASRLPFTYTGADFYALCSDSMLNAVTRQASLVDTKIGAINATAGREKSKISTAYFFDHYATKEDVDVVVTEEDFMNAERELIPSVSVGELEHYQKVRAQFEKVEDKPKENGEAKEVVTKGKATSNGNGKGKDKVVDRKGKGKAVGKMVDDNVANGYKGKEKAVDMSFHDGTADNDQDLY